MLTTSASTRNRDSIRFIFLPPFCFSVFPGAGKTVIRRQPISIRPDCRTGNQISTNHSLVFREDMSGQVFSNIYRNPAAHSGCHPGVWSARRKSQWLFLSGKRAAAPGEQSASKDPLLRPKDACDRGTDQLSRSFGMMTVGLSLLSHPVSTLRRLHAVILSAAQRSRRISQPVCNREPDRNLTMSSIVCHPEQCKAVSKTTH